MNAQKKNIPAIFIGLWITYMYLMSAFWTWDRPQSSLYGDLFLQGLLFAIYAIAIFLVWVFNEASK